MLFATWHAGLTAVPMNFRLHRQELKFIVDNAEAELCFASADLAPALSGLEREVETLRSVICTEDRDFTDLVADGVATMACAETKPDDPAWIFYTSGTTGRPKGATLTHRNLAFMTQAYFADIDYDRPRRRDAAPGRAVARRRPLFAAEHRARRPPGDLRAAIVRHRRGARPDRMASERFVLRRTDDAKAADACGGGERVPTCTNLRTIVYGGGPMYVEDLRQSLRVLGPKLVQIFGQGETPMTITSLGRDDHRDEVLHTCGIARTLVDVRVVDAEDRTSRLGSSARSSLAATA